jgi:S-formylglutathione hydrolase FrmB
MNKLFRKITLIWIVPLALLAIACQPQSQDLRFELSISDSLQSESYSGRMYVFLNSDTTTQPRRNLGWVNPSPFFAIDVQGLKPGESAVIDSDALGYPDALDKLESGTYAVQGVARRNRNLPNPGRNAGDLYSKTTLHYLKPDSNLKVQLSLNKEVAPRTFNETERIKEVTFKSEALSSFHDRPYEFRASVALPQGWQPNSEETWPVVYYVTGFGGSHHNMPGILELMGEAAEDVILVIPDARNYRGHSVFANSENTGPWGTALTEELIPLIDEQFGGAGAEHRYITGVSSGGWSSLWVQIQHPETFSGVWSIVPDPVDFRDFQQINLYAEGANMYHDKDGNRRPLARRNGEPMIWYDNFVNMESVLGPGGQIHSFEAVFSPRGANGKPKPLFDRKTGDVNPETVEAWKKYDINLVLRNNWETLGPKLKNKLHIYAGGSDTFYLEGAVELLKKTLNELGSDAEVEVVEGVTHEVPPGTYESMFETIRQRADRQPVVQ